MTHPSSRPAQALRRAKGRHLRGCKLTLSGMTTITVKRRPGNPAIVTFATELPLNDLNHGDLIGSRLHQKYIWMAYFTFITDSMKPVRKDDRGHLSLLGLPVHDNVPVLSQGRRMRQGEGHHHGHCSQEECNTQSML